MASHNWQRYFDHQAAGYMEEGFVQATRQEVEFLVAHLALQPGQRLLDIGCGTGRHAIELARRGYRVTGVDISAGMLAEARKAAAQAAVEIEWVQSPAQDFEADEAFDAVYSVCEGALSLLGLEDSPDRDLLILRRMFDALRLGGRGLITVLNGMRFLRIYQAEDIAAGRFDPLTMIETGVMDIETATGIEQVLTRERGYIPTELRLILQQVGFTVDLMGGGEAGCWRLSTPDPDEMELLALLHRPERSA